jgi:hypothetical protein
MIIDITTPLAFRTECLLLRQPFYPYIYLQLLKIYDYLCNLPWGL